MTIGFVGARFVATALAASAGAVAVAGCSSSGPPPQPGSMAANTARVIINGKDVAGLQAVTCSQLQWSSTIETFDKQPGFTVLVTNAGDKVIPQAVEIRDLGGFTGSYWQGLIGQAQATSNGGTYTIIGTAQGSYAEAPNKQSTGAFKIETAC